MSRKGKHREGCIHLHKTKTLIRLGVGDAVGEATEMRGGGKGGCSETRHRERRGKGTLADNARNGKLLRTRKIFKRLLRKICCVM